MMSDSPYIVEVDQNSFSALVVEASDQQPVLVDFWAEWCAPCRSLMPVLAKLADEFRGKFLLAKVNSDENQELAAQFGVRSLPTVKLFKNGVPVDEFMGALPESAIREFLDRHIEQESDKIFAAAMTAYGQGAQSQALTLMEQAHRMDPAKSRITLGYAKLLAETGDIAGAQAMLDELPVEERDGDEAAALRARLDFTCAAEGLADLAELRKRAEADDLEAIYQLSVADVANNDYAAAMEKLLTLMRKDRKFRDDVGRTTLLKLFAMLGEDPLVDDYRRKMMNLLY